MGPRRAPVQQTERRTKQRNDRPSTSRAEEPEGGNEREELAYGYLFGGDAAEHARFIAGLGRRPIIEPKSLDSAFFRRERFEVVALLEASNLRILAEMECPYSEVMVRAFYHNLSYIRGELRSRVCGVDIVMTAPIWTAILGHDFDAQPRLEYDPDSTAPVPGFVREDIIQETRRLDVARAVGAVYGVGYLNVEARVLHYVMTHIIFPRAFNHSRVLESDWIILWAIRHTQPLNWRHMICFMMSKAKYRGALPFAYLVQKILLHFNINMGNEVLTLNREYNARFGSRLLVKTGIHKVRGRWVWTTQPQGEVLVDAGDVQMDEPVIDEDAEGEDDEPLPQMAEPEGGWSMADVMRSLSRIERRQQRSRRSQRSQNERLRRIEGRLTRLEQQRAQEQPTEEGSEEESQEESEEETDTETDD